MSYALHILLYERCNHTIFRRDLGPRRQLSRAAFLLIEGVALLTVSSRFRSVWTSATGPTFAYLVQLFHVAHTLLIESACHIILGFSEYDDIILIIVQPRKTTRPKK